MKIFKTFSLYVNFLCPYDCVMSAYISMSLYLPVHHICPSGCLMSAYVCLSFCQSVHLSNECHSVCPSVNGLVVYQSVFPLSVNLLAHLAASLYLCLFVCQYVYVYVFLSICLFVCISFCPSITVCLSCFSVFITFTN